MTISSRLSPSKDQIAKPDPKQRSSKDQISGISAFRGVQKYVVYTYSTRFLDVTRSFTYILGSMKLAAELH